MSTKIVIDGEMVEIGGGGSTVEGGGLSIRVHAPTGSTVTAEKDGQTYTTSEQSGVWDIPVPEYGVYTVKATRDAEEIAEGLVDANQPEVDLTYGAMIYGVMWDSSNPSTALTRLTKFNDPNHLVNTNITKEPVAAVGTEMGSSPFDNCYPWNGMEEYNIIDNKVAYKKDRDSVFSRALYDTVVYIPKFWYHVIQDGTKWYWYIADRETDGFEKHPGSGRYVGRYNTGAGYVSKSGLAPLTSITRAQAREGSHTKGSNWWQYDYATWCAVWLLYLVEYADWDSQKRIGRGWVDGPTNPDYCNSGLTDVMSYHTGRSAGEDGKTAVQYRGIENPLGNVYDFVDGINFNGRTGYISLNNAGYQDDVAAGDYKSTGVTLPSNNNYISNIGYSQDFPWSFLPTESSGSETTNIPDQVYSTTGFRVFCVGGVQSNTSGAGLFCSRAHNTSSEASANFGSRLIYIPKEE